MPRLRGDLQMCQSAGNKTRHLWHTTHLVLSTFIMPPRSPYNGTSRKLLLAFDVGTTYSGISYSILDPGQIPETKGVTRFPAQERVGGDSKIPTIIYYDRDGKPRATGAEAVGESIENTAEDQGWTKAEWFKLHLRPKSHVDLPTTGQIPPLPESKTVVQVFSDFLHYLLCCAKTYICETHANGTSLWMSVEKSIEYVLTHPNGWGGKQQGQMRQAAILGGLIPDDDGGHARVHFVTEGEASLHFCIASGLTADALKNGKGVLIVDAGGGTIDLSAYGQSKSTNEHSFEEITAPQCHFKGSIFVTQQASLFIKDLLRGSRFSDDVANIACLFDKTTKLRFRDIDEPQFIKFGSAHDKDAALSIRSGQLKLKGADVASFFEPSIKCIIKTIVDQRAASRTEIMSVFLVGGFAASPWLYSRLKTALDPLGLDFSRPDSHVNKAVADGAISFYLDHFVAVRVSRYAYGIEYHCRYDPNNSEHANRSMTRYRAISGDMLLPNGFDTILPKDVQISETQEFQRRYVRYSYSSADHGYVSDPIYCYRGLAVAPQWIDVRRDMFSALCHVEANTERLSRTLRPLRASDGRTYYKLDYSIVLSFGLTELKAQICWEENGIEKRSPAKIVYDED